MWVTPQSGCGTLVNYCIKYSQGDLSHLFQASKNLSPIVASGDFFGPGYPDVAQDNMKDQAQLKYAVCMGILVMLHPGGWIGECAATMLSYKGRRLAKRNVWLAGWASMMAFSHGKAINGIRSPAKMVSGLVVHK